MSNSKQPWRVNSGMMARLTGTFRAHTPTPHEATVYADPSASAIADFLQTRDLIFHSCAESFRLQKPISLLVVTIDEFKAFEANFGKDAAAKAKAFIEETMCHHTNLIFGPNSGVVVGHYVESRYLVLLPGIAGSIAAEFAEYLRNAIVSSEFVWNFRPLHFTVSIGISHKPGHNGDQDMLILQADQACDQVTVLGGNRIAVARLTQTT